MASKKTVTKKLSSATIPNIDLKVAGSGVVKIRDLISKVLVIQKISSMLSILFYILWIPIGAFFLWFIVANFRLGAFDQLMKPSTQTSESVSQPQNAPSETTVPGVGRVNVACVQSSLSEDAILKMVQDGGIQKFTEEEKSKLEPCIIEKETESTEATPEPSQ